MNRVSCIAFQKFSQVSNRILTASSIVVVSNLVPCTAALAVDKIKCVVNDFHYGIWRVEVVRSGKLLVDSVTPQTNPEVSDKPVLRALGKELSKKLDGTGKFEVETRDAAELALGEKFKTASALVLAELNCTGISGTGPNKQSTLSIDARLVRMDNSEIVDVAQSSAPIEGGISWPKSLEEYSSADFQKSATGQALQSTLDQIATELSQKARAILKRLNPELNKHVPSRHSGK